MLLFISQNLFVCSQNEITPASAASFVAFFSLFRNHRVVFPHPHNYSDNSSHFLCKNWLHYNDLHRQFVPKNRKVM